MAGFKIISGDHNTTTAHTYTSENILDWEDFLKIQRVESIILEHTILGIICTRSFHFSPECTKIVSGWGSLQRSPRPPSCYGLGWRFGNNFFWGVKYVPPCLWPVPPCCFEAGYGPVAIVYRDLINVSPPNHNITHTSFEFQLVNIDLKSRDIVLANIYRPPLSSKSIFLEEFGSLLATLGTDAADHLMICGDFNLPGMSPDKIDDDLADLLNSTCFTQNINASTRHDSHYTKSSLLDLIITPSTSKFVSTTSVVSSHEVSDHDIALANLTTKRFKPPRDHINTGI